MKNKLFDHLQEEGITLLWKSVFHSVGLLGSKSSLSEELRNMEHCMRLLESSLFSQCKRRAPKSSLLGKYTRHKLKHGLLFWRCLHVFPVCVMLCCLTSQHAPEPSLSPNKSKTFKKATHHKPTQRYSPTMPTRAYAPKRICLRKQSTGQPPYKSVHVQSNSEQR